MHTYYDILGVSSEATLEEITAAKNNLAKIYHPDSNIHNNIDTTALMQEILEAYAVLADEIKRKEYDDTLSLNRNFQTYDLDEEVSTESGSFVTCWQAAHNLHNSLFQTLSIIEEYRRNKSRLMSILRKIFRRKRFPDEISQQLGELQRVTIDCISVLSANNIPIGFWNLEAMNWVLVHWGQNQDADIMILFHKYEHHLETTSTKEEKKKLRKENKLFQKNLSKLLAEVY